VEAEAANDQLGSMDGAALSMELDAYYDNLGTVPWHTACPGIFATFRAVDTDSREPRGFQYAIIMAADAVNLGVSRDMTWSRVRLMHLTVRFYPRGALAARYLVLVRRTARHFFLGRKPPALLYQDNVDCLGEPRRRSLYSWTACRQHVLGLTH
jgi:hypothetical protein